MGKLLKTFCFALLFIPTICSTPTPAQVPMTGPVLPEELRMLDKKEYSSITIALYMEKCINSMFPILLQNGMNPIFAKQSSFQVCGCAMDQTRLDMPEDAYLDMFINRREMGQAMIRSSMEMCGAMYGEYYNKIAKQEPNTYEL